MKKKIPFDISYREKVESGEVSVVTRDDRHVDILKWDANSNHPIIALITFRDDSQSSWDFGIDGRNLESRETTSDLFILVEEPEPELTEFEERVEGLMKGMRRGLNYSAKEEAAILLEAARMVLRPEFDKELEQAYKNQDDVIYQRGYDAGFAAGSEIDEERLTDKIAEKIAEKILKDGNPFAPNPAVPGHPWFNPIRPGESITVMYGVTPTEFRPMAADQTSCESLNAETYVGSKEQKHHNEK